LGDRWVNAVIEIRIPRGVPVDASREEKLGAVAEAMDRIQTPDAAVAACRCRTFGAPDTSPPRCPPTS
jgi:hypothetical protein